MLIRAFKTGVSRNQSSFLPPCLEDYVAPNNPVRAIDVFVDALDLDELGFKVPAVAGGAGQPPYHPGDLLKLYIYGYMYRIRSSRALAREAGRNLELTTAASMAIAKAGDDRRRTPCGPEHSGGWRREDFFVSRGMRLRRGKKSIRRRCGPRRSRSLARSAIHEARCVRALTAIWKGEDVVNAGYAAEEIGDFRYWSW